MTVAEDSRVRPRRALRIGALGLGQLTVVVAFQAVAIVVPAIGADLEVPPSVLQWLVGATALTLAGGLLLAGRLADRFGARQMLIVGSLVTAAGSVVAAVAPEFGSLLLARVAQGVGMALYTPAMISLLSTGFDDRRDRHRALIWWNVAGGVGGVLGVAGGGFVAQFGWRGVFWLLAVPPVITAVLAWLAFPAGRRRPVAVAGRRVAVINAALLPVAATLLVAGLTTLQQGMIIGAVPVIISVLLAVTWVARERRSSRPLVPPELRRWSVLQPIMIAVLHGAAINTPIFFYGLFLQSFRHATPLEVGLGFLPANAGLIAGSVAGSAIVRRWSHRVAAGSGFALLALGIGLLITINADSTVWHPFLTGWLIFGLGVNIAQVGFIGLAGEQSAEEAGTVAGFVTAGGQLGTAIGLAAFVGLSGLAGTELAGYQLGFLGAAVAALAGLAVAARR
ncbi:MFS transporter [Microlunatus speluncae]|uniref:MFS transporter n=1 Tax=Microlunatus speluncae TaxID=2594267 RepID=UPI00126669BF|nr:MFS transporter [Microlunatus speluncae]